MFVASIGPLLFISNKQQEDCHAGQHYKVDTYMDLYSTMFLLLQTGHSDMDHTVLPANYTMPALIPQPQSITALWLVLILPSRIG